MHHLCCQSRAGLSEKILTKIDETIIFFIILRNIINGSAAGLRAATQTMKLLSLKCQVCLFWQARLALYTQRGFAT